MVAFVAPTETGGAAIIDHDFSVDGGTSWASAGTTASPVTITGLTSGQGYFVVLRAVTRAGSGAALVVVTGSPVTEFVKAREEVQSAIVPAATQSLRGTLIGARNMMNDARMRFI